MRNCAGVWSRGLRRYCSSRISGGTHSAVQTSFTTIETKRYSSGRRNTPANIGKHISNLTERTSRWSRRHFRSALRNPGCLRSPRMGNRGGGRAAMYGGNLGRYLKRRGRRRWPSLGTRHPGVKLVLGLAVELLCAMVAPLPKTITMVLASGFMGMWFCGTPLNIEVLGKQTVLRDAPFARLPCDTKIAHDLSGIFIPLPRLASGWRATLR
jgi:hypothetical protein